MRILWCEEHGQAEYREGLCLVSDLLPNVASPCRMVPMRLIPDNGEKVIHGVLQAWNPDLNDFAIQSCAIAVINALDGETP